MPTDSLSRSQVDRAGDVLRKHAVEIEERGDGGFKILLGRRTAPEIIDSLKEAMSTVARFRAGHYDAMSQTFASLIPMAKTHNGTAGFRHKRVAAIVHKLQRMSGRLSQMEDIAGCRVVVPTIGGVFSVREEIERTFHIHAVKDYVANPKPVGYRGIHLVAHVSKGNPNMRPGVNVAPVEIQLRTERQGEWADTVEQLTDRTGFDLKGGSPIDVPSELFEYVSVAAKLRWLADSGDPPDTQLEARLIELRRLTSRYWG